MKHFVTRVSPGGILYHKTACGLKTSSFECVEVKDEVDCPICLNLLRAVQSPASNSAGLVHMANVTPSGDSSFICCGKEATGVLYSAVPGNVTCPDCLDLLNRKSEELRIIPVSRLEWDSQRMTVLCEFVIQELKDGAKIPDNIREELNDLLYLYAKPEQEA